MGNEDGMCGVRKVKSRMQGFKGKRKGLSDAGVKDCANEGGACIGNHKTTSSQGARKPPL